MNVTVSPLGIRWSTLAAGLLILTLIGGARRRPDLAVVAAVASAGGFEIVYQAVDLVHWRHWRQLTAWGWEAAALAGWVFLAQSVGIRLRWPWVTLTALCFGLWVVTGFDYNYTPARPFIVGAEIKNEVTKTAWAVMYLVGAWQVRTPPFWRRLR